MKHITNALYVFIGLLMCMYDRYWCKMTGVLLIICGIIPMVLEHDCTVAVFAFLLGIPMLFAKEEE